MLELITSVKTYAATFLLLWGCYAANSQNLDIKEISMIGNEVEILYDLLDNDVTHKFQLSLYSSKDNFILPLQEVEGDIGVDISVGGNKRIVWHPTIEFGENFKGDVSLELKGKLYIPFVTLNDFDKVSSMKRDRPYTLTWAAGRGSNVLTWDLYNSKSERVHTYTNIANVGEYEFVIPKDINPGKGYTLKITDQNNKEDIVISPDFEIKRRIPLYAQSIVGALAGGIIFYLVNNTAGGAGSEEPDEIPSFPCNNPSDCN